MTILCFFALVICLGLLQFYLLDHFMGLYVYGRWVSYMRGG